MGRNKSLRLVRAHGAIEQAMHWQFDLSVHEDTARNPKNNGPASIAIFPPQRRSGRRPAGQVEGLAA